LASGNITVSSARVIWTDPNRIAAMTKLPGKILVMLPPI
jgi:hypothetical protein